jgi:hypothetical protein
VEETFSYVLERLRRKEPREPGESIQQWEHRTLLLARARFYGREEAPKQVIRESRRGYGREANRHIG